jgi:Domain of unknown function (DUF5086)
VRFLMGALGVEANAVNVAEMGKSGDVPALRKAAESGTWGIAGTPGETRWIEIHQVEPWNGTRLYHIEVLGRMTGRPGWQVVHIVPHMAISEAALKRSVTGASHQRAVYPETFDGGYFAWRRQNAGGDAPICDRSVLECLN